MDDTLAVKHLDLLLKREGLDGLSVLMSLPAPCDELMNDSGQPSPSTMYELVPCEPGKRRYHIMLPAWWREGRIAMIFDESEIDS